ncbi:MAG: hypothetical protein ACYTEL_24245 [Planctomycetota bacterium]|jgi:hypothetical protein
MLPNKQKELNILILLTAVAVAQVLCLAQVGQAAPMATAFTYQGGLIDANEPADGLYDLQFRLYDSNDPCDGNQVGSDVNVPDVDVIDGDFTVLLDFGSGVFDGNAVWLEIGVRPGDQDDPNVYTLLSPRQELTPVPYSLQTRGIFVDDTRNVGIGTNSPMYKLDIRNGDIALMNSDGTKGFRLQLRADGDFGEGGFPDFNIRSDRENRNAFTIDEDTGNVGIAYANPGTARLAINGNVGIGTENPDTRLHVQAPSGNNEVTTFATNDFHAVNHTGSRLLFLMGEVSGDTHSSIQAQDQGGISNNNLVLQQFGGNVGIGTTSPLSKLAVGEPSHPGIHSSVFGVWDGPLGTTEGDELALASIGHAGPTNNVALGIRAYRTSSGSTWATEAIGLGMDVDQSVRIGASIWLNSYGNVGIGTPNPNSKLTVRGNILIESESTGAPVVELGEGLDYAEGFDVSTGQQEISPGAVLIIDADNPGKLAISDEAYDSKVAGIVAGAKGQGSGVRLGGDEFDYDVALAGRVYCNVDATRTGVEPGDLLTTSATPGYAMKSTDYIRAQGAILGKAMEKLEKGKKGQILVLVTLQ